MFLQNSIHTSLFGVNAEGHNFHAFWIVNEVMQWRGWDRVWHGLVLWGICHPTPHSTEKRFLLALNTMSGLFILHCLTISVAVFRPINCYGRRGIKVIIPM